MWYGVMTEKGKKNSLPNEPTSRHMELSLMYGTCLKSCAGTCISTVKMFLCLCVGGARVIRMDVRVSCCSLLQRVAACCSVLQCGAVWCSMVQYVAVCCSAVYCGVACMHSLELKHRKGGRIADDESLGSVLQRVAACCSVLQRVVCYSGVLE